MCRLIFTSLFVLLTTVCGAQIAQHGHAHNDYMHKRPLFEALENGFTSIEIDVFLHNNDLVVSHTAAGLDKKQDIEELYLKPIQKIMFIKIIPGLLFLWLNLKPVLTRHTPN
jgi:hypothetical protein